jgi:hypothetical protein
MNGFYRLWIFFTVAIAFFTFTSSLVNFNFYWLIPLPFSDMVIHFYNFLIDFIVLFVSLNDITIALVTAFSASFILGSITFATGYGIFWIRKGFIKN